ncbi:class I SAM-dependent methyltransferase [Streptomyces megasporus]|uniref:class I SAM-dependent methyltransferase n=1 Tax=Streptomyces megasporus TaxID=44060 RepID=UPI0004E130E4|nr:class I SAM-dependent methyltransferase [Streptomyces megasporus]
MTEPSWLSATRASYDALAADYAAYAAGDLDDRPLNRAMLTAFAAYVQAAGGGRVADVGCGTGRVTALLHTLGVDAFGVDLSPAMVELARRTYPDLRFTEGTMTELDLADGSLAGLVAWYSVIHLPPERLPEAFEEFHRVLAPGGLLLLAFQTGDGVLHLDEALGHEVSLDFHRLRPDHVAGLLDEAGFEVRARVLREPEEERTPQAYLLARGRGKA